MAESRTWAALAIFALVYAIILAGESSPRKLDRPAAGLIGGVLMVLCGVLTRAEAVAAIDFSTIGLLLGMMIVVHHASVSGLLDRAGLALVARGHSPRQILWMVCATAGLLSALFVNDTICLIMTPLLLAVTRSAGLPAEPYLLALATSSNVGSLMTITGNPQNMLIGQTSGWAWSAFAVRMVPVGLVGLAINALVVDRVYRCQLRAAAIAAERSASQAARPYNRKLARRTLIVLACLLIAFLYGAPMDVAALTAAVAILVLANRPPDATFGAIDWSLLMFFAGLFIVVAGVTRAEGAWLARIVPPVIRHPGSIQEMARFSAFSVAGSNLLSNVPFVMLLRASLQHAPRARLLWLMLAASSTLAGNLTLVGSVANLIVAQRARPEVSLSFWSFLRVGAISTVLTVLASVAMIWLYGVLGWA